MPNSIGSLRGSMTPAPRTPETQQLDATRGGTRDLSQQIAAAFSVTG